MVYAILAIGFLGFLVWGHHMFMSGMSPYSAMAFSILTMAIGVPSAIKTFNWIGTLWGGKIRFHTPMLFALGFVSLFVTGGVSGIFLGQPALDLPLPRHLLRGGPLPHDHGRGGDLRHVRRHLLLVPQDVRPHDERDAGEDTLLPHPGGIYAIFTPMHFLGMAGNPRRYSDFTELDYLQQLIPLHKFMTYAAFFTTAAQFIFVINLFWSMWKGPKANDNPWESTTLEWTTASPPPHDNFGGKTPVVYHGPYEYSVPGAPKDYVMQTDPAQLRRIEVA